jgi:hypothetical protein
LTEQSDRQLRPRHFGIGIGAALVVGVALVTGIGRVAGFSDVRRAIAGAHFGWLAVCVVGQFIVFAGYAGALRHAIASEHGPRIPSGVSVQLVFASFAATQLFAFGGAGGLAVVYWALRRVGLTRDAAAVRLIGLHTAVYLVFGTIGWCAAGWALATDAAPAAMTVPWLIGFPALLGAAKWFTAPKRVERWTAPAVGAARRGLATGVDAAWWVRRSLGSSEGRPLFVWAALYWFGDITSLWFALQAFGAETRLTALVVAYTSGYLVQSLPIPLIATGGVDAAMTFLLHATGMPLELALVGVVAHRVFAFWLPVIPGTMLALTLPRIGRSLAAASDNAPAQR